MIRGALHWSLVAAAVGLLTGCGPAVDVSGPDAASPPDEAAAPVEPADDEAVRDDPAPSGAEAPSTASPGGADSGEPGPAASPEPQPPTPVGEAAPRDQAPAQAPHEPVDQPPAAGASTAPIEIQRPADGGELPPGPVTAEGEATVYEGTVQLTLVAPDGSVVEEAFATATAGAPERGRWAHTFDAEADAPGQWTVVAAATDPSDGEGRAPARTEVGFHVVGTG